MARRGQTGGMAEAKEIQSEMVVARDPGAASWLLQGYRLSVGCPAGWTCGAWKSGFLLKDRNDLFVDSVV